LFQVILDMVHRQAGILTLGMMGAGSIIKFRQIKKSMIGKILAFLLFRENLIPLLENIHYRLLPDASLHEEDEVKPMTRFAELLKEAGRFRLHGRDWYIYGAPTGDTPPPILRVANRYDISYVDALVYVEKLAKSYSWSLIPWGSYGTGQMIGFISSNENIFNKVMRYLAESNPDLAVSSYTADDLISRRFKGGIFFPAVEHWGRKLWNHGHGPCNSIMVLSFSTGQNSPEPKSAEVVCESQGFQFGNPIRRKWIRIRDESTLLHYIDKRETVIITASGLNEQIMWLALQDFAGVAEHVNQDPLHFGLLALKSAAWIYIPTHYDEESNIYLNQDPAGAAEFLGSLGLSSAPRVLHKYFC
jgi:hypothetical protein